MKNNNQNTPVIYNQFPNNTFLVGAKDKKKIIISDYQAKELTLCIAKNAIVEVVYLSEQASKTKMAIRLEKDAKLDLNLLFLQGDTLLDLTVDLQQEGSNLEVHTLSLAQHANKNFQIVVNHMAPHTTSLVDNYGISFAEGMNNFNIIGNIQSKMEASNLRQLTKGLILSESGQCTAKPVLLIDYYDVEAYHGATVGKISDDDLFYLMSRGLSKNEAFMLVINGILEPFIRKIEDEQIKTKIMHKYQEYFR